MTSLAFSLSLGSISTLEENALFNKAQTRSTERRQLCAGLIGAVAWEMDQRVTMGDGCTFPPAIAVDCHSHNSMQTNCGQTPRRGFKETAALWCIWAVPPPAGVRSEGRGRDNWRVCVCGLNVKRRSGRD